MRGVVYKYTINNKSYIGKTLMEERKRINKHKYEALTLKSDNPFHRAIRKYGWEETLKSYEVIEVFEEENKDDLQRLLCEKETYYILKFNTLVPNGYNVYSKGSERLMHHYKDKKGMYEKISKSLKGKYLNNINSKKVFCVELEKWFPSVSEAGRQLGIDQSSIQKVCQHYCSTAGGYRFTYDENDIPDFARKTQEIMCVETGELFNSVRDVIESFNLPYKKRSELKRAIKHNWCFMNYHWKKTGRTIPCCYKKVL